MRPRGGLRGWKGFVVAAVILWLACGLQVGLAPWIDLFHASPDFVIVAISCLALFGTRQAGMWAGFVGGVLEGFLAGANLATYAISRAVVGLLAGVTSSAELDSNPALAFVVALCATLLARIVPMFVAPPGAILPFVLATIVSAVYNGVIAMPLYALLKRMLDPIVR